MFSKGRCVSVVLVMIGLLLVCSPAARAGGVIIYHSGEDVFDVADINDEVCDLAATKLMELEAVPEADKPQAKKEYKEEYKKAFATSKIGYKCQIFGLFWAYFHWWDCEPVVFKWTGADEFEYQPLDLNKSAKDPAGLAMNALVSALEQKAGGKKFAEAYPVSMARMGLWTKHGRWLLAGVVLFIFVIIPIMRKRKAAAPAAPSSDDSPGGNLPTLPK